MATEIAATLLQGTITIGLTALCANLYVRYQRPWFGWFALAWGVYVARLACILSFLITEHRIWLYWHQVTTGWTALVLLWASQLFLRQITPRPRYLLLALFPPLWSYIAIYELDRFILAALPAVLFLSIATISTGWVFWRHHRAVGSPGARVLAIAFAAWGLHHLDYPFLRAQGAWTPWGYYLDILFELLVGAGLVLLVLDDLGRGVRALSALGGDLQRRDRRADPMDVLLSRPLTLPGVRGSAMYIFDGAGLHSTGSHAVVSPAAEAVSPDGPGIVATPPAGAPASLFSAGGAAAGRVQRGAGTLAPWEQQPLPAAVSDALSRMRLTGRPQTVTAAGNQPFVAALPVSAGQSLVGALLMAGDVRNPFTALDDDFLLTLGQQVGAALEQSALDRQLASRTAALEQLSTRMVRQHEEERRRLSRELHDETAQVFSAVKMQLEALRPVLPPASSPRLDRLLSLVDTGIRSIRQVTSDLRPSLLDDLGLLPALRSLVSDFGERTGLRVSFHAPAAIPPLSTDDDLALFRALQEALSNVARHADARTITVTLAVSRDVLQLAVRDDGRGFAFDAGGDVVGAEQRMGLTGMRERMHAIGGQVTLMNHDEGAEVRMVLPIAARGAA